MEVSAFLSALSPDFQGRIDTAVSLAPLTTFRLGGPASVLVSPSSAEDVQRVILACAEAGCPLYVLGAGSNIIVPDEGIDGVVIRLAEALKGWSFDGAQLRVGAGLSDRQLAEIALDRAVCGFEWIYDIPGSVGGGVYMNAGNNDGEMSHSVVEVEWLDSAGRLHFTSGPQMHFGYRHSLLHEVRGIVVAATLKADSHGSQTDIRSRMDAIAALRHSKFPEETMCAGSVFRRPPGHFAGKLIEEAGCGGMRIGGALVSQKHKGFIVNCGEATAADVLALIELVKEKVWAHSGVRLQTEVQSFAAHPFLEGSSP